MNKTAFITGGSHGIGRGIALVLSDNGYDIAFTYNNRAEEAEALRQEIIKKGVRCFCYQASLDKVGVAEEVTAKAISDLGGISALICNAGITKHNDLLSLEGEFIDFLYNLNYRSYMMCAKTAANDMVLRNEKGSIVFISSTRSLRAYPEDSIYGGLKAALNRSVESMALDMAKYGIRINCVAPGYTSISADESIEELTKTGFAAKIPLKRLGTPSEVGYLINYIISDKAAYMTGNIIKLDGGLILPGMNEFE